MTVDPLDGSGPAARPRRRRWSRSCRRSARWRCRVRPPRVARQAHRARRQPGRAVRRRGERGGHGQIDGAGLPAGPRGPVEVPECALRNPEGAIIRRDEPGRPGIRHRPVLDLRPDRSEGWTRSCRRRDRCPGLPGSGRPTRHRRRRLQAGRSRQTAMGDRRQSTQPRPSASPCHR